MKSGSLVGNKYRLTKQIGEGAMGVVWAAVNEHTSREVALKLILGSRADLRVRLLREARACGSLSHRNIIEVLDVGQTDTGDPFLVMPLLSGETLADLLARQRRVDPPTAAQIGRDVARALAAAHAAKIIHRDLKPANIFLHQEPGADGTVVKVLDFGVAKDLSSTEALATVAGGAVGSPAYMSPEQINVERDLDQRTDIWSLGVVLFEMLTGTRPFQGETTEVIQRVLTGDIPRVSKVLWRVEPALDDLVARCLTRNRDQRIATAAELAKLLNNFVTNDASRVHTDLQVRGSSHDLAAAAAAAAALSTASSAAAGSASPPLSSGPGSGYGGAQGGAYGGGQGYPSGSTSPAMYAAPSTQAGGFQAPPGAPGRDALGSGSGSLHEMDEDIATVPVNLGMLGNLRRPSASQGSPQAAPQAAPHPAPQPPQQAAPQPGSMRSSASWSPAPGGDAGRSSSMSSAPGSLSAPIDAGATATEPLNMGHLPWHPRESSFPPDAAPGSVGGGALVGPKGTLVDAKRIPKPQDDLPGGGTMKMSPDMLPNISPLPHAPPSSQPFPAATTSSAAVVGLRSDPGQTSVSRLAEPGEEARRKKRSLMLIGICAALTMASLGIIAGSLLSGPSSGKAATAPELASGVPSLIQLAASIASAAPTMERSAVPANPLPGASAVASTGSTTPRPPAASPTVAKPTAQAQQSPPPRPTNTAPPGKSSSSTQPIRPCGKLIKTNCRASPTGI